MEIGLEPDPDLTIYNPIGPSVTWSHTYESLRGYSDNSIAYGGMPGYEYTDFGSGFSHPYNIGIVASTNTPNQVFLVEANGARISLSATQGPTAATPHVTCTVQAGIPMLAEWDYDSNTGNTYFIVTQPDRSQWIMRTGYTCIDMPSGGGMPGGPPALCGPQPCSTYVPRLWYPMSQIKDELGYAINLNYNSPVSGVYPVLTSITDQNNLALLTFTRDGNNAISQVSDRYGRSVYYHVGSYTTAGVPFGYAQSHHELDHVSQVVATGTSSPPDRQVFGYANVGNGEGSETIPMLHTVTVPSPTGTGTKTATINYLAGVCTVLNVVDANGNTHAYNQVDSNHTQIKITDAGNNIVYRYTAGYDMNMSVTSLTNGTTDGSGNNTQIISSTTYADPNDPLRPSQIQDGVGYGNGGSGGQGTTSKTWDPFGNCLTMTNARSTEYVNTSETFFVETDLRFTAV